MISISNILIFISFIFTILVHFFYPEIWLLGMNTKFLNEWVYHVYFIQFFTSNFIHGWFFHFIFNSVFIYYFWNQVEFIIWRNKYLLFFILNAIFIGLWLTFFSSWNTVGISWFALAILTFFTLYLRDKRDPEYKWWITAIVINILMWFSPQVSLMGHLFWVIFWVVFYYILKLPKTFREI